MDAEERVVAEVGVDRALDADLDLAADALTGAAFGSAGERCMAVSVAVAREYVDAAEDAGGEPDFAPDEPGEEGLALLTATIDEEIEKVFFDLPDDNEELAPIAGRGEEAVNRLMEELGKNEKVTDALARAMEAKGKVDERTRRTLGTVGLAAADQLEGLRKQIETLEKRLAALEKTEAGKAGESAATARSADALAATPMAFEALAPYSFASPTMSSLPSRKPGVL